MKFSEIVTSEQKRKKTLICVGLDPEYAKIPEIIKKSSTPLFDFNKLIVDATAEFVCCFKPQFAHYAALGKEKELEESISYIKINYPEIPVILDSKRGDVGNTAKYYAVEAFDRYGADAVTLSPYLGFDAILPFLEWKDKGLIILCKTSNPDSGLFQDKVIQDKQRPDEELYLKVAHAVQSWSKTESSSDFALVVGATHSETMKNIRAVAPTLPFLVPGIGAQGGDLKSTIENAHKNIGDLIISSSRAIIHSSSEPDFDKQANKAARALHEEISKLASF